jgi:hypothetical protein
MIDDFIARKRAEAPKHEDEGVNEQKILTSSFETSGVRM